MPANAHWLAPQVRDEWVTQCGVRFEDDGLVSGQSEVRGVWCSTALFCDELRSAWQWKLDDVVLIESDIHAKRIESCEKERRKAEMAERKRLLALEKAERARIPPMELFRVRLEGDGLES